MPSILLTSGSSARRVCTNSGLHRFLLGITVLLFSGVANPGGAREVTAPEFSTPPPPSRSRPLVSSGIRKLHPSESRRYLRNSPPIQQAYSAVYARKLIGVNPSAINRFANLESYLGASLSSARGQALEAETAGHLRSFYRQQGGTARFQVHLTALERGDGKYVRHGMTDPADLVVFDKKTGRTTKYQCKAGRRGARNALLDPKYEGMVIVTTKESREAILADLDRKAKRRAQRGLSPPKFLPEDAAIAREIKRGRLPGKVGGQPLTSNKRILETARNAIIQKWDKACLSAGKPISKLQPSYRTRPKNRPRLNGASYQPRVRAGLLGSTRSWLSSLRKTRSGIAVARGTKEASSTLGRGFRGLGGFAKKALGPLGAAMTIHTSFEAYTTWESGLGSDTYFALKAVSVGADIAGSGLGLAALVALGSAPEPFVTKVAAAALAVGLAADYAADKLMESELKAQEQFYSRLTVSQRFAEATLSIQGRSDELAAACILR